MLPFGAAAKSYSSRTEENRVMSQPTVTIRTRENGPLVVSLDAGADVRITDHLGNVFPIPAGKTSVALCRCGASKTKPFCDGQHKTCGFVAAETAVPPGTAPAPVGTAPVNPTT